jgi:hypothetical protein
MIILSIQTSSFKAKGTKVLDFKKFSPVKRHAYKHTVMEKKPGEE